MKQKKPPPTYGDRESLGLRQDEQKKNRCPLLVALGPYNYQGDFFFFSMVKAIFFSIRE